jgi:mannose-1-phosphate guanylyltransferase
VLDGGRDLVVVDTGDVLLVCRRDQAGRVREIVESLGRSGLDRYLV